MVASGKKSKKPFAANLPLPPEPLVFFVDRALGKKAVPDALRAAGEQVEVHADHFPEAAPDADWLRVVGERGWIVLSKDKRIRYRRNETDAIQAARVRAFFLAVSKNLTGQEMGEIFVRSLPAMKQLVESAPPPFIAHVYRDGSAALMLEGHSKD